MNPIEWSKWLDERPLIVRNLANRFPPNKLYKIKSTKQRVTILSYYEDGTLKVYVGSDYNAILFERQVFGIKPEDLEESALPSTDEITGILFPNA